MTIFIQTPDGARQVAIITLHNGASNKQVELGTLNNGSANKVIYSALSVTASPSEVNGSAVHGAPVTISTGGVTASGAGGTGGYSYAWTVGDTSWFATAPSSAATDFYRTGVGPGETWDATFTCTVTDSAGGTATTTVHAIVQNYSAGGA